MRPRPSLLGSISNFDTNFTSNFFFQWNFQNNVGHQSCCEGNRDLSQSLCEMARFVQGLLSHKPNYVNISSQASNTRFWYKIQKIDFSILTQILAAVFLGHCVADFCWIHPPQEVEITTSRTGGVTGRPETMCPRANVLGPLVPDESSRKHNIPVMIHPCHFASTKTYCMMHNDRGCINPGTLCHKYD